MWKAWRFYALTLLGGLTLALGVPWAMHHREQAVLTQTIEQSHRAWARWLQAQDNGALAQLLDPTTREASRLRAFEGNVARQLPTTPLQGLWVYGPNGESVVQAGAPLREGVTQSPLFAQALSGQSGAQWQGDQRLLSWQPLGAGAGVVVVVQDASDALAVIDDEVMTVAMLLWAMLAVGLGSQFAYVAWTNRRAAAESKRVQERHAQMDQAIAFRTKVIRENEQKLTKSVQEQDAIFENTDVGLALLEEGRFVKANRTFYKLFRLRDDTPVQGLTAAWLVGQTAGQHHLGRQLQNQVNQTGRGQLETYLQRLDDAGKEVARPLAVRISVKPVHPTAGIHQSAVWMVEDIEEYLDTQMELRIAAQAFDSQSGMGITDQQGRLLRVNKAFEQTTGYTNADVLGQPPALLNSARHPEAFYAGMWQAAAQHGYWEGEVWTRRKDGSEYPEWRTISAVRNELDRVVSYVTTHDDITDRKQDEDRIRQLAFYDQLTQLPNRTLMHDRLRQAMANAQRTGDHSALIFVDLDNFKTINDTLGHDHGDVVLLNVARDLQAAVRANDTVARLGGDEFVVILNDLGQSLDEAVHNAETVGQKILVALKKDYSANGKTIPYSGSLGATLFGRDADSLEELVRQADVAMYRSKAMGKDFFTFFDEAMDRTRNEAMQMELDLREAVKRMAFELHYQPQWDVKKKRVVGYEALLRWQHPTRGELMPETFIGMAERLNLVTEIGHWVVDQACQVLSEWKDLPGMEEVTVALNVSVTQFNHDGFVASIREAIERWQVEPRCLKLEITESLMADDIERVIAKMSELRELGVVFALDDFGTGYSSMAYLSRLPIQEIKIDKAFVQKLPGSANDMAICAAMIYLAHTLGKEVVAEGVENEDQRHVLADQFGADLLQGYSVGRPLSARALLQASLPSLNSRQGEGLHS